MKKAKLPSCRQCQAFISIKKFCKDKETTPQIWPDQIDKINFTSYTQSVTEVQNAK